VVSKTFSATLGLLLRGTGNDANAWGKGKKKGAGGRPRSDKTTLLKVAVVRDYETLMRSGPNRKVEEIRSEVGDKHHISPSYVKAIVADHRKKLGIDPDHPHKPTSWDEFHSTVKPGQFYVNPADGKVYKRKPA
jgi:hypothetical protein